MVKAKKINVDKLQPFVESLKAYLDSESINIQDNNVVSMKFLFKTR